MYTSSQPRVPEGLRDMMKNFTKTILKEKPHDIYEFSEQYFQHKLQEKNNYVVKDFEPIKTQYDFSYTVHQNQTQHHSMPLSLAHSIVPSVISELMKGFIKAVLKQQPHNLCEFGVAYFRQLRATYCVQHEISYEAYDNYLTRRAQFPGTPYIKCTCGRILANDFTIENKRETTDSRENMASQISSIQNSNINRENIENVVQNYSEPHLKAICTIQRYIRTYLKKKTLTNQQLSKPGRSIECAVLIIQKWIRQVLKTRSRTEAHAVQHVNGDNSELETSYTSASTAILSAESPLDSSEKRMQETLNNVEDYKIDHLSIEESHKEAIKTFEDTLEKSETNHLNKHENTNQIELIPKNENLELDSNKQSINLNQTNNTPEICGEKKIQFHTEVEDQVNNNEDGVNASSEISGEKDILHMLIEESTVLATESENLSMKVFDKHHLTGLPIEPIYGIQKEKEINQNLEEESNDIKLHTNEEQCLENFEKETTLNESSSNKEDEINPDPLHINKEILVEDNLKEHSIKTEEESLVEETNEIISDDNGTTNMNSNNSRIVFNNTDTEPSPGDKFQIENSSDHEGTKLIKFNKSDSKEVSGLKTEDNFQIDMLQNNESYGKEEDCEGTQRNIQHFELSNKSYNDIRSLENVLNQKDDEVIALENNKYNKRINKTDDINKEEIEESLSGDKHLNDESTTIQHDSINREDGCDLKNNPTDNTNSNKEDIMKSSKEKRSNESEILGESNENISINVEEQKVNQPPNEDNCSNKTKANSEELRDVNEGKDFDTLEENIIIEMTKNVHKQEILEEVTTTEEKFTNSKAYETNEKQKVKTTNEVNEENSVQMLKEEEIITSEQEDERIFQNEIITTQENLNTITPKSEMMHFIEELNTSGNITARKKMLNQIDREMETSSSSSLNPEEYLDLNSDTFDERIPYEPINENVTNKVITDNSSEGTHINGSSHEDELPRPLSNENQSTTNLQTIQNSNVISEPALSGENKNEEFLEYNKSENIALSYENFSILHENTESADKSETENIVVPSINEEENDTITPKTIKMDESTIVNELKIKDMVTQAENLHVLHTNNELENLTQTTDVNNLKEDFRNVLQTDEFHKKSSLFNSAMDPEESNKTETLSFHVIETDKKLNTTDNQDEKIKNDQEEIDISTLTCSSLTPLQTKTTNEVLLINEKLSQNDKDKEITYIDKDDKEEKDIACLTDNAHLPSQTSAETGLLIKKTSDEDVRKNKELNSVDEDHKKDKNVSPVTDTSNLLSETSVETIISIANDTIREENEKISTNYINKIEDNKEDEIDNDAPMGNNTKDSIEIPSESLTTNIHSTSDTSEYHGDDAAVHTIDNIANCQSSIQSGVKSMENTSDIINKETEKSNDETKNISEIENITSQNCGEGPSKGTESHEMYNKLTISFDKSGLKREETTEETNSTENVASNISSKNEISVNEAKMLLECGKSSAISEAQESEQSKSIEEDTIKASVNLKTIENSQVMSDKEDTTRKLTEFMNENEAGQAVVETTKLKDTNNSNESYKEERTEEKYNSADVEVKSPKVSEKWTIINSINKKSISNSNDELKIKNNAVNIYKKETNLELKDKATKKKMCGRSFNSQEGDTVQEARIRSSNIYKQIKRNTHTNSIIAEDSYERKTSKILQITEFDLFKNYNIGDSSPELLKVMKTIPYDCDDNGILDETYVIDRVGLDDSQLVTIISHFDETTNEQRLDSSDNLDDEYSSTASDSILRKIGESSGNKMLNRYQKSKSQICSRQMGNYSSDECEEGERSWRENFKPLDKKLSMEIVHNLVDDKKEDKNNNVTTNNYNPTRNKFGWKKSYMKTHSSESETSEVIEGQENNMASSEFPSKATKGIESLNKLIEVRRDYEFNKPKLTCDTYLRKISNKFENKERVRGKLFKPEDGYIEFILLQENKESSTDPKVIDSVVSQELIAANEACENQSLPVKIEAKEINDIISVPLTDPIVSHERGLTADKDIETHRNMKTQLKMNNDFKTVLSDFLNSERMHSYTVNRKVSFPKYDLQDITEVVNEFMGTIMNINEEPPCIKKTLKLTLFNDDDNNIEMNDGSSQQRNDSVENISDDDSLSKKTKKMQQPESVIERMKQRQESTSRIQTNGMAKIRDVNFEEPTVKSIDTSPDTDEDKIIIKNMPKHQESTESSHNSDDVVYGNGGGRQNEVKTLETHSTGKESLQLEKKETDKSNKVLKPIIKSVTIDDSIHYIARSQFKDSFVMDDDTTDNIRRKIMAYSISDTDSDYIEKTMMGSEGDRAEDKPLLNYDHFNISTALMDNGNTSTETESTIVSAVTKIQAGTRGYLTRKRLGRTSVTSGTRSSVKGDSKASFGNAAFSESIEHLVQEAAAKLIQNAYRKHYKEHHSRINTQRSGKTSYELAGRRNLLAQRRLTLQRGDALQNDSTPDEPTSSSSSAGDEKLTEANKFVHTKKRTVITSPQRHGKRTYGTKLNWISIRQNSMPVQIDSEVFRVIPKRLRKRIQSAENNGKKTTSRSTKN